MAEDWSARRIFQNKEAFDRKFFFTPKDDTGRLLSRSHLGEGDRIELDASEN
jgi:hypothetical protein